MTTFGAFYDASGSESDKTGTLVVIGLAATEEKWKRFENGWVEVLTQFRVPYFHMKELNQRKDGIGIYAKWRNDDETPKAFLRSLLKVVKRHINKTFCYATILEDYAEVDSVYHLRKGAGSPYVLTAGSCYDLVNLWWKKNHSRYPILHVFEEGDCGQKNFLKLARKLGQNPATLPKKDRETGEWYVYFQGSDLIAGAYRAAGNLRGQVEQFEDYGDAFNEAARMLPQKSLVYHKEILQAMCELNPSKYPRR